MTAGHIFPENECDKQNIHLANKGCQPFGIVHNHWNEHFFIRAWQVVGISISADIFFLHSRKILIEGMVEIFPVAIPESHANAPEYNPLYAGVHAGIQQIFYVISSVIDKRQDRCEPHYGWEYRLLYISSGR